MGYSSTTRALLNATSGYRTKYTYDTVAFLVGGVMNGAVSTFSNINVTSGAFLLGDTDLDGDVDDADLGTSFSNYTGPGGVGKTLIDGDTDGDGDVDDGDLGLSFSNYTGPLGPAVPEPTSLALLGLGGLLVARRRRSIA